MKNVAEHLAAKFALRKGAAAGVTATVTMDCSSALVHRLGLTAPLAPDLIGLGLPRFCCCGRSIRTSHNHPQCGTKWLLLLPDIMPSASRWPACIFG